LGVLRLEPDENGERLVTGLLRKALKKSGMAEKGAGRTLYLVGGSWRALARIDMLACHYPLPITHGYCLTPERARKLRKILQAPQPAWSEVVSPQRFATLPQSAMLLRQLVKCLKPARLVVSTFGIREGLLYADLK